MSPFDLLDRLAQAASDPNRPESWRDPLVQVQMRSGATVRGHMLAAGRSDGERERHFILHVEPKSDAHLARDVAYVNGADVESVLVFEVDELLTVLPQR